MSEQEKKAALKQERWKGFIEKLFEKYTSFKQCNFKSTSITAI